MLIDKFDHDMLEMFEDSDNQSDSDENQYVEPVQLDIILDSSNNNIFYGQ